MSTFRLRDFNIGDAARIVGFAPAHRGYRAKLLSMGLTKGTVIHVRNIAPLGDPIHISVRDFDLSLRRDEAETLVLEPADGDDRHVGRGRGRRRRGRGLFGGRFFGRGRRSTHGYHANDVSGDSEVDNG